MRKFILTPVVCLTTIISIPLLFSGCKKNNGRTFTYTMTTPVLKAKSLVFAGINGKASQPVQQAGKIYAKDNYIFLNEVNKGIHIINNIDPAHPVQVNFLNIPGNLDIAIKGHTLYADMNADLLAIDISNPKKVVIEKDLPNFFTARGYFADTSMVAVDWIKKDTTVTIPESPYPGPFYDAGGGIALGTVAPTSSTRSGVAGSMAAMILMNNYIYAITEPHSVGIVNISNEASPVFVSAFNAGFDLETMYPFEDKLFLGSSIGLFMYDMSDPEHPSPLGQFSHGRACDPVVTDGNYAYVTLHAGSMCGGDANELNIVDVKDLMNPTLIKTYPLTKPTGLSKDGNLLFICDDNSGVRVYDAEAPSDIKLLKQLDCKNSYDVIAANGHALVVADDGLYQYDYSNLNNIRQISFFSLKN
ncbi:LVIVD repeat-containing protein [Ferruginibacter albus]|uniref:LVIVD repeat-containing protein n=1 Tax=Ferruginibacter albus TaxID=2875540 RepID=UPI001CC33B21|nr:hypothetical protein [Ferruginibacter albus]UAY53538.1 hypothetical protein K9M53_07685 [Ferruginibacter albus]